MLSDYGALRLIRPTQRLHRPYSGRFFAYTTAGIGDLSL